MTARARRQPFYQAPKTATGVPVTLKSPDPLQAGVAASLYVCPTCDVDEWLAWKMNRSQAIYLQCAKCSTIVQLVGPAQDETPPPQPPVARFLEPRPAELAQEPAQEPGPAPESAELAQEPPAAQIAAEPYQEPAQESSGKKGRKNWREER